MPSETGTVPLLSSTHVRLNDLGLNEEWLQERIAEDPALLGLGEGLIVRDRERRQYKAGRLDLLLEDPEPNTRFEVELMLGDLDESHIIRAIEYWDIERRRYPAYDHCAVIVAENVTSRFLNVLSLFSGTIPMIVLQMNALKLEQGAILHFSKILDQRALRDDDIYEGPKQPVKRDYWVSGASEASVRLAERLLVAINGQSPSKCALNFNKGYVGLECDDKANNYVLFWPRKKKLLVGAYVKDPEYFAPKFEQEGALLQRKGDGWLRVTLPLTASETLIRQAEEFVARAAADNNS